MRWSSLLSTVVFVGCAAPHAPPNPDAPVDHVQLQVKNETELDAVVYAYRFGQRYRLGFVVAHTVATLRLPLLYTDNGQTALYVHHIGDVGNHDFISNVVQIDEESQPVLFLYPDINSSSLAVFPRSDP